MKMLEALSLATPYIHAAFKHEPIVAVIEKETQIQLTYLPGRKLDAGSKPGEKVNPGDQNIQTALRGENSIIYIPSDVYGLSMNAVAFPIREDGEVVGALAFGFPLEDQEKLDGYMESINVIINDLQDKVHVIASHSEELAATSEEINMQSQHALEDSERTNGITGLIKSISTQTNLLGLNASIEAARAGQHGAGFNIVAQEVRKLSMETSKATEQIESSLQSITGNLKTLKESMSQIKGASNEQATLVQDFSTIIDKLNSLSNEMKQFLKKA
ncbi:methyl-accepting chemotaxis protein [Bacillus massiliigorillae]|uniref:methyl-accepting chemotaxis protein n=1 Tax=Bacillus massiliigorillae TaxID=1243664 RepID=UPI0003A41857|nr:methyl-accepting chemotaxis protein [Bacillus massiliigorillae]